MKRIVLLLMALVAAPAAGQAPVVVELFTSQGCSSCPPADRLLGELAERRDIVALAFHVDYWDYIGWKDAFAAPEMTARQKAYARAFGRRGVYTPQAVIDGATHEVGSDRLALEQAIGAARRHEAVEMRFRGNVLVVGAGRAPGAATLWLACWDRQHEVAVGAGENAGRHLAYHHVVRHLARLGSWDGAAGEWPVDLAAERAAGRDGCAALLQAGEVGPILGATQVELAAGG